MARKKLVLIPPTLSIKIHVYVLEDYRNLILKKELQIDVLDNKT